MSEKIPRIITTRGYRRVARQRDAALEEIDSVRPYLGLAQEIQRDTQAAILAGTYEDQAVELAVKTAKESELRRLIQIRADTIRVQLTESQMAELKQEFIASEQVRIDQQVAQEVAGQEAYQRRQVAAATERELALLKREELLKKIGTEEAIQTLRRFGDIAVKNAHKEALVEELKYKAATFHLVDLADIPTDSVLSIGLGTSVSNTSPGSSWSMEKSLDRILALRVLNPAAAMMEIVDDSWMNSGDTVRRHNAMDDLALLTMRTDPAGFVKARFSLNVEPDLYFKDGQEVNLFGLEVNQISIYGQTILSATDI